MLFATDYPGVNKGISMKPSINPEYRTVLFPEPAADVVKSASGARGPRRAEGLRMDARRAKTWRSLGLVHDSRTPPGGKPKLDKPLISIELRGRKVAKSFVKQALNHHRGRALKKMLLTADIEPHRIDMNDSRPFTQST